MNTKPEKFSLFYGVSMFDPQPHKGDDEPPSWIQVALGTLLLIAQAGVSLFVYFLVVFALMELLS